MLLSSQFAQAQSIPAVDLRGYAWSSNIGWISLNCQNDGSCAATNNYKVTINSDRTITGWGWSSNIGWVKFGGLSAFPAGGGNVAANAQLTGTYPNLTWEGWVRACAGTLGGNCSSMSNNGNAGSWDGWIALRGTNHTVSANLTSGMNPNSYAWGNEVVGWIDMFSNVQLTPALATISGSTCVVPQGASSCGGQLTWSISSSSPTPNAYRATAPVGQLSTAYSASNQSVTLNLGTNTFQARSGTGILASVALNVACDAGLTVSGGICVATGTTTPTGTTTTPMPTVGLQIMPPIVRLGNTASLSWNISSLAGSSCVINAPGLSNVPITSTSGSMQTGPIMSTVTVRLTCTGSYGIAEQRGMIEVVPVAVEV